MTKTRLCLTVQADSLAELRRRRDEAVGVDLVELRLDGVADLDVRAALADRRLPVVATCRPVWEGGAFNGSEEERLTILRQALELGAEFVDVEWKADYGRLLAHSRGRRIVLSSHDFDEYPPDLADRAKAMLATGAEVVKLAVAARRLSDCVRLLQLSTSLAAFDRLILIGMGECGLTTRVCAAKFGAPWTYAGRLSQVGQVGVDVLLQQFRFRSLGRDTALYGIIGRPVAHSVSPAMHNAAFAASSRDAVYLPLPAADADDAFEYVKGMPVAGASITIPFKVALADRVDAIDGAAREVGAINTVRGEAGRWLGMNSDIAGFLAPLTERGFDLGGMRVSVVGAGGSARAVVAGLVDAGARVTVHARRPEKARALAETFHVPVGPWPPERGAWDLLVNCTPVGMHPLVDESPVPADRLTGRVVYDLVYNPVETRLLREAAAAGCDTIGGLAMLVAQAQEQARWWTGERPPTALLQAAAERRLEEFSAS